MTRRTAGLVFVFLTAGPALGLAHPLPDRASAPAALGEWLVPRVVAAQAGSGRGPRAGGAGRRGFAEAGPPTPAAVEALFERFVVRQARQALQLTPEQSRVFEPRLRRLHVLRRRLQRERQRLLNDLQVETRAGAVVNENAVADRLAALETFRASADIELRDARRQVDEVLTVEQRARFALFERRIERQTLELLAQARREAARGRDNPPPAAEP